MDWVGTNANAGCHYPGQGPTKERSRRSWYSQLPCMANVEHWPFSYKRPLWDLWQMGQKFRGDWRSFEDWTKSASRNAETNDKFSCINLIPPSKITPSGILGASKQACYLIRTLRTVTIFRNSTFLCKKLSNSSGASAFSSILLKLGSYRS